MDKRIMVDYRVEEEKNEEIEREFVRKAIDNNEFCIRNRKMYFSSDGEALKIPVEKIVQVFTN